MRRADAKAPDSSPASPPSSCAACREELQLRVVHCPFCGTLQAVPASPVDTVSMAELLDDVDWAAMAPPVVASAPVEDLRPAAAGVPTPSLPSSPGAFVPSAEPDAPARPQDHASAVDETAPKGGRAKRRLVAVALTVLICAALLVRYAPPAPTVSTSANPAAVPSSAPVAVPVPMPTARSVPPAPPPVPEPSRSSVRLTKTWKTVRLGPDGHRTSTSFEGNGPFRIRAGGRLYVVDGSIPVELDLRGLVEVDLRAVADAVTVDVVAVRNRSLVGN